MVRIESIEIKNIKNVSYGKVFLDNVNKDSFGGSITGIYGQNGSGKTALIFAMGLLHDLLSGTSIQQDVFYYIMNGQDTCSVNTEFSIENDDRTYSLFYSVVLKVKDNNQVKIYDEKIEIKAKAYDNHPRINLTTMFEALDQNDKDLEDIKYLPKKNIDKFFKSNKQKLIAIQMWAKDKNISYFFNPQFLSLLKPDDSSTIVNNFYLSLLNKLSLFGCMNMFVLNKNSSISSNIDVLPLSVRIYNENYLAKSDWFTLKLTKNQCDEKKYKIISKTLEQINILVNSLVPGLKIEIVNLENTLGVNGEKLKSFELASNRGGIITPLKYESEGIKKILCVLSSLIAMYNDKSIFVAIDELDSGIFEYLLGEFLNVIKENGKGQLVFTSHNMRPLEVLDSSNIYVTTTNPNNKYIQFNGIKENNNLRSVMLRTIDLGGQKEEIYEPTSKYQIANAFRKAGERKHD